MEAVRAENADILEILLASGADVNQAVRYRSLRDGNSWKSPLDLAEEKRLAEIAELIRAFGDEKVEPQ